MSFDDQWREALVLDIEQVYLVGETDQELSTTVERICDFIRAWRK